MATHSSILAWKIPWTEDPGRLQSMGSQRVGHDWETSLHFTVTFGIKYNSFPDLMAVEIFKEGEDDEHVPMSPPWGQWGNTADFSSAHHLGHCCTFPGGQRWQKHSPLQHREPGHLKGPRGSNGKWLPPQQWENHPPSPPTPTPGPSKAHSRGGHLAQPGPPHSSQEAAGQDGILLARLFHKSFPTLHPPCEKTPKFLGGVFQVLAVKAVRQVWLLWEVLIDGKYPPRVERGSRLSPPKPVKAEEPSRSDSPALRCESLWCGGRKPVYSGQALGTWECHARSSEYSLATGSGWYC